MGCTKTKLDQPPTVVRPKVIKKKQDNEMLLTELSDLDDSYSVLKPVAQLPKFYGRNVPTNRVMPVTQKLRLAEDDHLEKKAKDRELKKRQEEQIKSTFKNHHSQKQQQQKQQRLQFKLQHDEEIRFKEEMERVKASEMLKQAVVDEQKQVHAHVQNENETQNEVHNTDRKIGRTSRFNLSGVRKVGWDDEEIIIPEALNVPDPRPPTYRKKDIVPNIADFRLFDKHAIQAPPEVSTSVSLLVNYLKKPAENQFQLVRMFYRWITFNISFDVEGFYDADKKLSTDAEQILINRVTTAEGYANLMAAMCRYVNLPAKIISGLVKGFDYEIGDVINFAESNQRHFWNAIYVNDNWFFVDCTWGSGHVDRHRKWHRQFQEFYFIVDPDKMIIDHFPLMDNDFRSSAKWQLLASPISANSFNQRLKMERAALEWDVKPMSHTQNHIIIVRQDIEILLQEVGDTLEDYLVRFQKKDGSRDLDPFMFAAKIKDRTLKVVLRPPDQIDYILHIYGKRSLDTSGKPDLLVTYILKCVEVLPYIRKFPVNFRIYGAIMDYRRYGFSQDIANCVEYTSHSGELILPFKAKKDVRCMTKLEHVNEKVDLTNFCLTTGKVHGISIKIRLPFKGYYKFTLFGKVTGSGNFRPVATFMIDCLQPAHVHSGFPVAFEEALRLKCALYKPLWRDLPANSQITIILGCPTLHTVRVLFQPLNKDENGVFEGTVTTPPPKQPFTIYGQETENGPMIGLYHFSIF